MEVTPGDLNTATIEFGDDPEPHNTAKTVAKLEHVIRLARTRTTITQQRDDEMASSIDFLKKVRDRPIARATDPDRRRRPRQAAVEDRAA